MPVHKGYGMVMSADKADGKMTDQLVVGCSVKWLPQSSRQLYIVMAKGRTCTISTTVNCPFMLDKSELLPSLSFLFLQCDPPSDDC